MKRKMLIVSASLALCILSACSGLSSESIGSIFSNEASVQVSVSDDGNEADYDESECTIITINQSGAVISGEGAEYKDGYIYITEAGDYLISGSGTASIYVNAYKEDNVRLILSGVNITSDDMAPIYIEEGKNVYLVLDSGTSNIITDNRSEKSDEEETDITNAGGAIYTACDLIIKGSGSLEISSDNYDGINAKDDIKIKSGNITIKSGDEGIDGNDSFEMEDGSLTIESKDKGIKINDSITIDGGTVNIDAGDEGMQALDVIINDGDINIDAKDDGINISDGTGSSGDGAMMQGQGGFGGMNKSNDSADDSDNDEIESETVTRAPGGRPDGNGQGGPNGQQGEKPEMPEGFDGEKPEMPEMPEGSDGEMPELPEGMDGERPELPEGMEEGDMPNFQVAPWSQEDNDTDNNFGNMMPGFMGMGEEIDGALYINGGNLYINAYGDAIDSNGSVYITGGYIELSGPENGGNGTLDYNGQCEITGGTLIMTGSSGMIQEPEQSSEVLTAWATINGSYDSSDIIEIYIDGNKAYTLESIKKGNYISVSDPSITENSTVEAVVSGQSYTLSVK